MTGEIEQHPFRLSSPVEDLTEHERALVGFWRDVTAGTDPAPDLALVQRLRHWWMKT